MTLRRVFIAGLVGCAMLAGCNNADDKAPIAPDTPQGTFAGESGQLTGQADPGRTPADQATTRGFKDALDALQASTVILQGDAATSKEALAALRSAVALVQSRVGHSEALEALAPRIDRLDVGLKSLADNFKPLDGRMAAAQADLDTLEPLREQFAALKDDYGKAIKLKLEAAALAPLRADIDLLKTGKADAVKLADLQTKLDGLKDAVDKAAKLSAGSAEGFSKRIAALEGAVRKLKGKDNAGLICVSSVTPNGGMPPSALITFD